MSLLVSDGKPIKSRRIYSVMAMAAIYIFALTVLSVTTLVAGLGIPHVNAGILSFVIATMPPPPPHPQQCSRVADASPCSWLLGTPLP